MCHIYSQCIYIIIFHMYILFLGMDKQTKINKMYTVVQICTCKTLASATSHCSSNNGICNKGITFKITFFPSLIYF